MDLIRPALSVVPLSIVRGGVIFALYFRSLPQGARRRADLYIIPFDHIGPWIGQGQFGRFNKKVGSSCGGVRRPAPSAVLWHGLLTVPRRTLPPARTPGNEGRLTPANLRMPTKIGCMAPRHTRFGCGWPLEADGKYWKSQSSETKHSKMMNDTFSLVTFSFLCPRVAFIAMLTTWKGTPAPSIVW